MPSPESHGLRPSLVLLILAVPLQAGYLILSRLHNFKRFAVEYIAVSLAISLFYLVACWWVSRSKNIVGGNRSLGYIFLAGVVFRLTVVPFYPSLTEDPFRYRWEGRLQLAGGNPYLTRPDDPSWAGLRDRTWGFVNRKDLPGAYGPLLEWSYRWTYATVSRLEADELGQVRLFKLPFLVFELGTAVMLIFLLQSVGLPREWVLIYLWSPLVVVEFWGSGHNDPLLLFFLVAAVWAGHTGRWGWAMGGLWMATLTKLWPALLFPVFLAASGLREFVRRAGLALAWTPLLALLCLPYGRGISELRQVLPGFLGGWRNNASLFHAIYAVAGRDYEQAKPIVAVAVFVATLAIAWRRPPLIQGVLSTTLALLFLSANCFPWYVTWIVPLLAVVPHPALLLWTALVPLAYHILIGYHFRGEWQEDPFYLYLEYVPVYGMLVAGALVRRFRRGRDEGLK